MMTRRLHGSKALKRLLGSLLATLIAAPAIAAPAARPKADVSVPYVSVSMLPKPATHQLLALARLRVVPQTAGLSELKLHLQEGLKVSRVNLNGQRVHFTHAGDILAIALPAAIPAGRKLGLEVYYAGRPLAISRHERVEDLGPEGLVLAPQQAWYPRPDEETTASVRIALPPGWRVTGPAQLLRYEGHTGHLEFTQRGPIALVAGPLSVVEAAGGRLYLRGKQPARQELARAAGVFASLHARGLLSAQKLGTLVELPRDFAAIALPGWQAAPRPAGSLGDWLLSAQWSHAGTPLQPVERQWLAQGLAAYTADLGVEKTHGKAAYHQAMREHLARYQDFWRGQPGADQPLTAAIAPGSPAWRAEVGDKAPLVWALLRQALGDAAFWSLLKRHDGSLETLLQAVGPERALLESWLNGRGLPVLRLEDVQVEEHTGTYQVHGTLVQDGPAFRFPLDMELEALGESQRVHFETFAGRIPFHFVTQSKPLRLMLDPAEKAPVARRSYLHIRDGLEPADGVIVYGTTGSAEETAANQAAARAMRERLLRYKHLDLPLRADKELSDSERRRSLLIFGNPSTNALAAEFTSQFPVRFMEGKVLWWQGRSFPQPDSGTVEIIPNPLAPDETAVLFATVAAAHMKDTLRYSQQNDTFCLFEAGQVVEAGLTLDTFPELQAVLY